MQQQMKVLLSVLSFPVVISTRPSTSFSKSFLPCSSHQSWWSRVTNKINLWFSAKLSPVSESVELRAAPNKVIIQSDLIELPVVRNIWGEVKWEEISSDQQYPRVKWLSISTRGLNGINGGLEDFIVDQVGYEGRELPQSDYTSWLLNNCILMSLSSPQIWSII